jgi:hypothetical protein
MIAFPRRTSLFSLAIILTLAHAGKIAWAVYHHGFFVDEVANIEAFTRLVREGNYTSSYLGERFSPRVSSGWVTTLGGGLGWLFEPSIVSARWFSVLWSWILAATFGFIFAGKSQTRWAWVGIFWGGFCFSPYWYGYAQSLGEVPSALLLLCSIAMMDKNHMRPGAFVLGCSVWFGKLILLPSALCALLLHTQLSKGPVHRPNLIWLTTLFILPQLLWMGAIGIRFGASETLLWLKEYQAFLLDGNSGAAARTTAGLLERLKDPNLEWIHYPIHLKVKILSLLTLGGVAHVWLAIRYKTHRLFSSASVLVLGFYGAWYFLWHPQMWIRHLQPALILAYASILYSIYRLWIDLKPTRERGLNWPVSILTALISFNWAAWNTRKTLIGVDSSTFAIRCRNDLRSIDCSQ